MKTRIFPLLLLAAILVTATVFPASAEAPEAVRYPEGTVLLDEARLTAAADFSKNFKVGAGAATYGWNAETGRVRVKSTKNTVLDIEAIPNLPAEYTVSADLYLTESTFNGSVLLGMGINTADAWSRSAYFQMNVPSSGTGDVVMYINNYDQSGNQNSGGGSSTKKLYEAGYKIGESHVNVMIQVSAEKVIFFYDGTLYRTLDRSSLAYPDANPFFILRTNSTLEIDNLTLWAGTKDANPEKTAATGTPIALQSYQTGTVYESEGARLYDVRLLATVDSLEWAAAGFDVVVKVGGRTYRFPTGDVSTAYSSVLVTEADGQTVSVPAPEGKWFIALTVRGIPESEKPEFIVSEYVRSAAGAPGQYVPCTVFTVGTVD